MSLYTTDAATYAPAEGWYFTHPANEGVARPFHRVVLWRIERDGTTTGMISVATEAAMPARLHLPPDTARGQYVHVDDMTDAERHAARHGAVDRD